MAYALVVESNASPAGAASFTISKTPTSGNLLILAVHYHSTSITLSSVSDDVNGSWTLIGNSPSVSPGERVGIAYIWNVSGSACTITVTASSGTPTCSYSLSEWSGFGTSNPLDKSVTGSGASGDTSVTLTGVAANALVFMASTRTGGNSTPGAAYTGRYQRDDFYYEHGEYDLDSGASGNIVVDATGASSNWTAIAASFAVPAGGGAISPRSPILLTGLLARQRDEEEYDAQIRTLATFQLAGAVFQSTPVKPILNQFGLAQRQIEDDYDDDQRRNLGKIRVRSASRPQVLSGPPIYKQTRVFGLQARLLADEEEAVNRAQIARIFANPTSSSISGPAASSGSNQNLMFWWFRRRKRG